MTVSSAEGFILFPLLAGGEFCRVNGGWGVASGELVLVGKPKGGGIFGVELILLRWCRGIGISGKRKWGTTCWDQTDFGEWMIERRRILFGVGSQKLGAKLILMP